jgi:hypothetical protein
MADFADLGAAREEMGRALALKLRAPEGPPATGFCLCCDAPLCGGLRWCDADCRDDWQVANKAGRAA